MVKTKKPILEYMSINNLDNPIIKYVRVHDPGINGVNPFVIETYSSKKDIPESAKPEQIFTINQIKTRFAPRLVDCLNRGLK